MFKRQLKAISYAVLALVSLLLAILNVYAIMSFDVFGLPIVFALALSIELLLIISFIYLGIASLEKPLRIVGSILKSAWQGAISNAHIVKLRKSESRWLHVLKQIIRLERSLGIGLSTGLVVAGVSL